MLVGPEKQRELRIRDDTRNVEGRSTDGRTHGANENFL
jgi:hypothetical protein